MENIKKLDLLGASPNLLYSSKSRFKTYLGAFLSVIIFSMSASLLIYFFVRVFSRANVMVVESREYIDSQEIDLSEYPQLLQVSRTDGSLYAPEEEQRLFSFTVLYFYTEKDGDPKQTYESYLMEPCTPAHLGKYDYLFADFPNLNRYHCLPLELKFKLYGIYGGNKRYSSTFNAVRSCVNGEHGASNCFSKEKILEEADNFYINFAYIDYNVQSNNIDQPGVPYVKADRIQVGVNFFKRLFYEVNVVEYQTDYGFVFESTSTANFFTMSNYSLIPDKTRGDAFAVTSYILGRNRLNIKRSFEKFQEVLSNIGGAIKALTICGQLLLSLATSNFYFFYLSKPLESKVNKAALTFCTGKSSFNQTGTQLKKTISSMKSEGELSVVTNLRLVCKCMNSKAKTTRSQILKVKEFLSVEKVVSNLIETENLKNILFSPEGKTVLEHLGLKESKKIDSRTAFNKLCSRRRNEVEERLFLLSTKVA